MGQAARVTGARPQVGGVEELVQNRKPVCDDVEERPDQGAEDGGEDDAGTAHRSPFTARPDRSALALPAWHACACGGCRGLSESSGGGTALFAVGGAVLGVVVGSVVGGIIGASHSGERWEQVPANRWRLSAAPRPHGGFALGLSVAF